MAASYPATIWTPTVKTDKVDLVAAEHINRLQEETVAVQTELGTGLKGTQSDLVARLARALATSGAIAQGTSFPSSPTPVDGQMFYRTDQNVLYIYNGSSWDSQGQSLSNVVFSYFGQTESSGTVKGEMISTSRTPSTGTSNYRILANYHASAEGGTYITVLRNKFKKIAGISTVQVYLHMWQAGDGGNIAKARINIGGQTVEISTGANEPYASSAWFSGNVDVSSLSDGTVYDVTVELQHTVDAQGAYIGNLIAFGV